MSQEDFEGGENRLWHMRNCSVQFLWQTISVGHLAEELGIHYIMHYGIDAALIPVVCTPS